MNCPNCGNELHIDETQQTITCECGKVYKNPMYKPPVEEKKMVLKEKKTAKSKLPYILIIATMVLVIASLVVGSVCLATVKPVTGVAMAKKLQKDGYNVALYSGVIMEEVSAYYPADSNGRMIAILEAYNDDYSKNIDVYYFSTAKAASAYFDVKCSELKKTQINYAQNKDYTVEIRGNKVFYGNKEAIRDAMN